MKDFATNGAVFVFLLFSCLFNFGLLKPHLIVMLISNCVMKKKLKNQKKGKKAIALQM